MGLKDFAIYSILVFSQIYTTCILFGMISDFYRPYSAIFFIGFNIILYLYELILLCIIGLEINKIALFPTILL